MNKFVRTISHPGSKFSKKTSLGLCTWAIVVVHLYCGFSIRPDRAADSIAVQTSGWEWPTAGKSRCSNSLLLGQKSIHKYKPEHPRCFEVRWGTVPYLGLHLNRYLFLLYSSTDAWRSRALRSPSTDEDYPSTVLNAVLSVATVYVHNWGEVFWHCERHGKRFDLLPQGVLTVPSESVL